MHLSARYPVKRTPPVVSLPSPVWKGKGPLGSAGRQDFKTIVEGQKLMVDAFPTPNGLVGFQVPGTPWSPGSPQGMPTLSLRQCCKSSSQSLQWTPPTDTAPSASSRWKAVPKTAGSIADGNLEAQVTASFALGSPPAGLSASSPSGLAGALQVNTV